MKEKEIKTILKTHVEQKTPDVLAQIDLASIQIDPAPIAPPKKRFAFSLKLALSSGFAAIVLILAYFIFWDEGPIDPNFPFTDTQTVQYANQIGQGLSFVANFDTQETGLKLGKHSVTVLSLSDRDKDVVIDTLHSYMSGLESLYSNSQIQVQTAENQDEQFLDYAWQMQYQLTDIFGTTQLVTVYFNFEEVDEGGIVSKIQGIIITDVKSYHFVGQEDITRTQGETRMQTTLYLNLERTDYITIEQGVKRATSVYEHAYTYTIYKKESLIQLIEVEYEVKDEQMAVAVFIFNDHFEVDIFFELIGLDENTFTFEFAYINHDGEEIEGQIEVLINREMYQYEIEEYSKHLNR